MELQMRTLAIFHPSLIDCMANARAPQPVEVQALAERIWSEVNGAEGNRAWGDLPMLSLERRRAVAAARLAFGHHLGRAAESGAS